MKLDECFEIGFIIKPHGLKGALNIRLDVDEPEKYRGMESVIVKIGGDLIPFFISNFQIHGEKGILQLADINTIEAANQLKSCPLLLPLDLLPKLGKGQFYYHDIIGYSIVDRSLGKLGTIQNVYTGGNQDLIEMKYKKKDVLIPVNHEIVGEANHEKREVNVMLPDGLLDIYL